MSATQALSLSRIHRRRPTMVLTDHTMHAVAADLPPMGGGFSRALIALAQRLEIRHHPDGGANFALVASCGKLIGETDVHPPKPSRAACDSPFHFETVNITGELDAAFA